MFQAGDLLVYGSTGVCRVLSIDRRQERVGSIRQERLYYQLKPIYQGGLIYTPVDNDKVSMRPIISRQEAEDLISEIPTLHPAACRASTTQALTQQYQASLRQHDCRSLVELAMSIHAKRRQAESQNRRLGMVDERYLKQAEQLLFGELAGRAGNSLRGGPALYRRPDRRRPFLICETTRKIIRNKRGPRFREAPQRVEKVIFSPLRPGF